MGAGRGFFYVDDDEGKVFVHGKDCAKVERVFHLWLPVFVNHPDAAFLRWVARDETGFLVR